MRYGNTSRIWNRKGGLRSATTSSPRPGSPRASRLSWSQPWKGGVGPALDAPGRHPIVGTVLHLLKASDLTPGDIETIKLFSEQRGFDLVYYPGMTAAEANRFNRFPEPIYENLTRRIVNPAERNALYDHYPFDIRP